jgi:hypothetical protein
VKRLGVAWLAALYLSAAFWGMTGAGVALIVGCVVFVLAFPQYVQVDPLGGVSDLDRRDGIGAR